MINGELTIRRPLRWGMVGGGRTGQVGYKHRTGALRDGTYQLLAGAFDINAERGRDFGVSLGLVPERCYETYRDLIRAETERPDGVEIVSVATPNFTHYEITKALLDAGIHVICEKPLFFTSAECQEIEKLAEKKGLIVGVTYGFTGHPMVRQMANMVKKGELGEIRLVDMQYTHGFNAGDDVNASDAVKWRTNPLTAGPTFVLGDIGTHVYYLSEIVLPQLRIERLLCDRKAFIQSRSPLEDHATVLMHYHGGARGRIWVSSVNAGNMGSQRYRFIGSKASFEWSDSHPDQLIYEIQGEPTQILHHGMPYLEHESLAIDRMGALHTEGLGDSWANIYLWIAEAVDAKLRGDNEFLRGHHYPGIKAGAAGVRWLENCVRSADAGAAWVDFH
ncbi:Gfo/Idh/MocA family protein [Acidocella facilis]|uniref:Gfo/Idh/MocA family protein n=1 Tax=Acidocella facilis TaxID=525 RepID=UPI001F18388F|nr:Gfo/Idh/MocA family oxidoreductase [Acidocella facilis]